MTYKTIKDEFGNLEIYYEADCPENSDYLHKTLKGLQEAIKTLNNTEEELSKHELGKSILKTKQRDKIQNETILNLIRIRESEFLKVIKCK